MDNKHYLSIDIGGTFIKYGVLDHSGNIISKNKKRTSRNIDDLLFDLSEIVEKQSKHISGIGISAPGKVDTREGVIYGGGNLTFLDNCPIVSILQDKYKIPIAVENDGKSAALAEMWLGNLQDVDDGAAIILGTGIGGGIVLNKKLRKGKHYSAGEISFMINKSEEKSDLKFHGFNASAVRMVKTIGEYLGLSDPLDGEAVFKSIISGNDFANQVFINYCDSIAELINNIQCILELEKYVIGGGISTNKILIEEIENSFNRLRMREPLLQKSIHSPIIKATKFNNDANLYGALYNLLLDEETIDIIKNNENMGD
ncbi:ROK family protein [Clostridium sporogenes]|uniref:ROK family protein n=1 Tax=Clostridium sporogenes TaxID=1509 RepID=A0A1L3NGU9_CLOSG|nr:ROK family protein [Clostridium sporogenes]APH15355.1 ROK family protein [Clostridium sporogenes]